MQGAYYNYRMHMGTHYLDFGASPSDYSTSVIGNASVEWIRQELNVSGASEFRQPLFGWIGLWAPHADFTPAPWHAATTDARLARVDLMNVIFCACVLILFE